MTHFVDQSDASVGFKAAILGQLVRSVRFGTYANTVKHYIKCPMSLSSRVVFVWNVILDQKSIVFKNHRVLRQKIKTRTFNVFACSVSLKITFIS